MTDSDGLFAATDLEHPPDGGQLVAAQDFNHVSWLLERTGHLDGLCSNRVVAHGHGHDRGEDDLSASRSGRVLLSSPAGICGLAMPVLLDPGEHVLNVVPHVPAELQIRRTRVRQTPVLQRALGQSEQLGQFPLGEERRSNLGRRVHTH